MFKESKSCWSVLGHPLKHGFHEMQKQLFLFAFELFLVCFQTVIIMNSDISYPLAYREIVKVESNTRQAKFRYLWWDCLTILTEELFVLSGAV